MCCLTANFAAPALRVLSSPNAGIKVGLKKQFKTKLQTTTPNQKSPESELEAFFGFKIDFKKLVPRKRSASLVFCDPGLKEVFLFFEVGDFGHPWEWIVSAKLFR